MSTPNAIEIVREYLDDVAGKDLLVLNNEIRNALASLQCDADRFNALAKQCDSGFGGVHVETYNPETGCWRLHRGTLAELADKLRSEK
jgi:hypothetical protein